MSESTKRCVSVIGQVSVMGQTLWNLYLYLNFIYLSIYSFILSVYLHCLYCQQPWMAVLWYSEERWHINHRERNWGLPADFLHTVLLLLHQRESEYSNQTSSTSGGIPGMWLSGKPD